MAARSEPVQEIGYWIVIGRSPSIVVFTHQNPLRIGITIPLEGDELSLTFDGRMEVVSMDRNG